MHQKNSMDELYIYGRQPVLELLRSSHAVLEIWLGNDVTGMVIKKIENSAHDRSIKIKHVNKNQIQKWTGPVVHQGVAARIRPFVTIEKSAGEQILKEKSNPFVLILDQVQDPHNLGAILRSAESTGVDLVVLPEKGSAPLNATVAKTSAGALFHLNLMICKDLPVFLESLAMEGLDIIATLPDNGMLLPNIDFTGGIAVIIGSEGKGVRKNLWQFCTHRSAIPQIGRVNSLNASVAAGIVLYEVVRQRLIKSNN